MCACLGLLFSVLITAVITDAIKDAVGRPRPDFFWRCFPDGKGVGFFFLFSKDAFFFAFFFGVVFFFWRSFDFFFFVNFNLFVCSCSVLFSANIYLVHGISRSLTTEQQTFCVLGTKVLSRKDIKVFLVGILLVSDQQLSELYPVCEYMVPVASFLRISFLMHEYMKILDLYLICYIFVTENQYFIAMK